MSSETHLDARLDAIDAYMRDTRAMAMQTRDTVQREIAQVEVRRPQLDGRLDRLEQAVADVRRAQAETNALIERALLLARFVRWTATAAAAVGASVVGVAGWWTDIKAMAGWK